MKWPRPSLVLAFLVTLCFTLATCLAPRSTKWSNGDEKSLLKVALGDARLMLANHFYTKADVYFHSGYYPTMFEQAQQFTAANHLAEHHAHSGSQKEEEEEEKGADFLGKPHDWIDAFGRHFYPSTHSHLDKEGEAKEILPWLRISAELDPHRVETYTVAAFFLVSNMRKPDEAEAFLRQGLRENPNSPEILFELGKIYEESRHDTNHAENLWELALRRWQQLDASGQKPEQRTCNSIVANLAVIEEQKGNLEKSLSYLEIEAKVSPEPAVVEKRIQELKAKAGSSSRK